MPSSNRHSTPIRRNCLSMQVTEPVLFPPRKSKKRQVNENINGYVYSPRIQNKNENKLPSLKISDSPRQAARMINSQRDTNGANRHGYDVRKCHSLSEDILPPLKFHASLHNGSIFNRRTTRKPRWTFQEHDVITSRFQDDTFRIFRPMLYSVLMTSKILPKIRTSDSRATKRRASGSESKTSVEVNMRSVGCGTSTISTSGSDEMRDSGSQITREVLPRMSMDSTGDGLDKLCNTRDAGHNSSMSEKGIVLDNSDVLRVTDEDV